MPTTGTTASTLHPAQERMLAAMFDDRQPATRADVRALAAEVAALREALTPQQSPIIHGADALREFAALQAKP